jgi:hypothetical protein
MVTVALFPELSELTAHPSSLGQTAAPVRPPASVRGRSWIRYARLIVGRSLRRGGTYIGVGNPL